MSLFFRVLEGPQKGEELPIEPGHLVGRKGGPAHIQLQDPKISGHHAQIEGSHDAALYLVDNKSKNGLRVGGERMQRIELFVGQQILIGNSLLEVCTTEATQALPPTATLPVTPPTPTSTAAVPKSPEKDLRTWSQILEEFTFLIMEQVEDRPKPLVPVPTLARLSFLCGLQAETVWEVGYGPRRVGANSVDMPILEPFAPDICFELIPTPQGLLFKTGSSDIVLLNDKSQSSVLLKEGDVIRIHDTKIEVGFSS